LNGSYWRRKRGKWRDKPESYSEYHLYLNVAADSDRDLTLSEIDPSNEVLDPALKVLEQSRRRILIVDAVGLGTTSRPASSGASL